MLSQVLSDPIEHIDDIKTDIPEYVEDVDVAIVEEQVDDVDMSQRRLYDWKPIDQVSPKQGRLIMFPARQYHAGSPPKKDRRMLINFNFSMSGLMQ